MIFGTPEFFHDAVTGKRLQVCICDARFPDGQTSRIHIFADKDDGYYLGAEHARYELRMAGTGNALTAVLTPRDVIEIRNERDTT